jgi:hypothetical protein
MLRNDELTPPSGAQPDWTVAEEADRAEALFREARRRRRRRWSLATGGVAVALVAAVVGVVVSKGPGTSLPPVVRPSGTVGTVAAGPPKQNGTTGTSLRYIPIQGIGSADVGVNWVANGAGIYLTTDTGHTWRTITPPILNDQDPSEHITSLVGVGSQDLWMTLGDVIGIVPPDQSINGSVRGSGIERSTDGGRTWTFGTLVPGCLQTCGADSLSFIDPENGFATGGNGEGSMLFSTTNGGATWPPVASLAGTNGIRIELMSPLDGWAVSGNTIVGGAGMAGLIYRTTNRGLTGSRCPVSHRLAATSFPPSSEPMMEW